MKKRLANALVFASIATNLAIIAYGASSSDPKSFFGNAFPVVLLVGIVGGLAAVLDARQTHAKAKESFSGTTDHRNGSDA